MRLAILVAVLASAAGAAPATTRATTRPIVGIVGIEAALPTNLRAYMPPRTTGLISRTMTDLQRSEIVAWIKANAIGKPFDGTATLAAATTKPDRIEVTALAEGGGRYTLTFPASASASLAKLNEGARFKFSGVLSSVHVGYTWIQSATVSGCSLR